MSDFAGSQGQEARVSLTPSGEVPTEGVYNFSWINTNTTTIIPANVLHTITINNAGAGGNHAHLYNGTVMANNTIGSLDTTISGAPSQLYDVSVSGTLTVVTLSGVAPDMTVTYA